MIKQKVYKQPFAPHSLKWINDKKKYAEIFMGGRGTIN